MRRWRVFGVDDEKALQLHEAFARFLTTRDEDGFGIEMTPGVYQTTGDVPSALRAIAGARVPFDCVVIDINLNHHHDHAADLPKSLAPFNKPYGNWIGRYVIQAGFPTEILYYSERERDLLTGFDLPSMGVRFVPGNQWETLCERVLDVLEQRQALLLNRSVEGRARLSELLGAIDQLDTSDPDAIRKFLAGTFVLTEPGGETDMWRCGDFFLRTSLALASSGPKMTGALAVQQLRDTLSELQTTGGTTYANAGDIEECGDLIAKSRSMKAVFSIIRQVAPSDVTVLINGDTGTGKELVAREIHRRSRRARGRFVAVNCSAIPGDLIESELFGHEKGAFTGATDRKSGKFEQADKGTIFLDEVGDMSLAAQAKVLRVLQEREIDRLGSSQTVKIDVRVIAATHRDLRRGVDEQWFREDLFHRLCVIPIGIPPLRERTEDIGPIAARIVDELVKRTQKLDSRTGSPVELSDDDVARLRDVSWTGNVRELRNVLEAALVLTPDGQPLGPGLELTLTQRFGDRREVNPASAHDAAVIWARIKRGQTPGPTLGDLETELGRPLALAVAKLALDEYSMADAAASLNMSYRNFEQWLRRRGFVKGQPRGRYVAS